MMQKGVAAAETQSEDASSLLKLYRTKLWLQNRLLRSQEAATAAASRTLDKEDDIEAVLDRVAKLQKSLQTVATKHTLGELLKQRLELSTGLSEAVFPALSQDVDATWDPAQQQALQALVARQGELNTNICKIHKEMMEKKPTLIQLEKQNLELKLENRELMARLLERKRVIEKSEGWRQRSAKVQRAEGRLSDMVSQVTLMQNSFQCLVVGSAVDWAVDDRLCELMVSLGKPLNMQLDDLHDSDVRSDVDTSH